MTLIVLFKRLKSFINTKAFSAVSNNRSLRVSALKKMMCFMENSSFCATSGAVEKSILTTNLQLNRARGVFLLACQSTKLFPAPTLKHITRQYMHICFESIERKRL